MHDAAPCTFFSPHSLDFSIAIRVIAAVSGKLRLHRTVAQDASNTVDPMSTPGGKPKGRRQVVLPATDACCLQGPCRTSLLGTSGVTRTRSGKGRRVSSHLRSFSLAWQE